MIKKINKADIIDTASLVYAMYKELFPNNYSQNPNDYLSFVVDCMNNPNKEIFIDDKFKGFLMVEVVVDKLVTTTRIDANKIYVVPSARNGKLLKGFYDTIFSEYPTGDILGVTEIHSKHIPVLNKRHEHIANVYKLTRS